MPPPLPVTVPVRDSTKPLRARPVTQVLAGLAMFATAILLALEDAPFRRFEALTASPIAGFVTGRHGTVTSHDLVYFALGTRHAFGIEVTNECTSALLLIPLLVMIGSFTVFSRIPLRRELLALAVGAGLMFVVNILRVAGIAWSTWKWGLDPGYKYSHVFVGSAFSLVGFVGAMLLALWVLVRSERMKQAAVKLRRAFWVATAPASHRAVSAQRGESRGRKAEHRYHRHR